MAEDNNGGAPAAAAPDPKAAAPSSAAADAAVSAAAATDPKAAPAAGSAPAAAEAAPPKGVWPEDWARRMSKGDENVAKQFSRYASPEALAEAHISLRRKMDAGEFKSALPKDPKPEELAAWRKDNGIPEKPDGYDLSGIEIPEADKEIVGGFLETLHAKNASPEIAREAIKAYYSENKRQIDARLAKDDEEQQAATEALAQEWGGSHRRNLNLVKGMLSKFPESVRELFASARLPNGSLFFNHPDVVRGFLAMALEANPAGIVVPAGGADLGQTALEEYRSIQKFMAENRTAYNKDESKQSRMRELIDYLQKNEMIDANGKEIAVRRKAA